MENSFGLTSEQMDRINHILKQLYIKSQASCILLADISGQLISLMGRKEDIDPVIVAALTASDMSATAELARQIGEESPFKLLFHEGERQNLYLSGVGDSFIMIVIFKTTVPIGLVRIFTKQAIQQLLPLADEFEALLKRPAQTVTESFGHSLAEELDQVFGDL